MGDCGANDEERCNSYAEWARWLPPVSDGGTNTQRSRRRRRRFELSLRLRTLEVEVIEWGRQGGDLAKNMPLMIYERSTTAGGLL